MCTKKGEMCTKYAEVKKHVISEILEFTLIIIMHIKISSTVEVNWKFRWNYFLERAKMFCVGSNNINVESHIRPFVVM